MTEKKIENPIPKPLQRMLTGFGINPDDLFLKVKIAVENEKNAILLREEKEKNDL